MNWQALPLFLVIAGMASAARAEIEIVVEHNDNDNATAEFRFSHLPPPAADEAIAPGQFKIIDGEADPNSGGLDKLTDGKGPSEEDKPGENFFFAQGTEGGRLLLDLHHVTRLHQVNTYSWHPGARGPQVYKLYGATGLADNFNAEPKGSADPQSFGWKLLAQVDTRPKQGEGGGQYGVSIRNSAGPLGEYRYLLFACAPTETSDIFGHTFYSEIEALTRAPSAHLFAAAATNTEAKPFVAHSADGHYEIVIDYHAAPNLAQWATNKLAPVLAEWYPAIIAFLPSDGYEAPQRFTVVLKPGRGVAATSRTRVTANATWIKGQLNGEALGALVHEAVHVVQQYGRARRDNPHAAGNPGWLTEGIADYFRWYKYEPNSHGAEITQRTLARARYDAAYRPTANFLNWVSARYDTNIVPELNAAMRQGNYSTNLWIEHTGKPVEQLGADWLADVKRKVEATEALKATKEPAR